MGEFNFCPICWEDARIKALTDKKKTRHEHYQDFLEVRGDLPCKVIVDRNEAKEDE
jgi:hypothetical protein